MLQINIKQENSCLNNLEQSFSLYVLSSSKLSFKFLSKQEFSYYKLTHWFIMDTDL